MKWTIIIGFCFLHMITGSIIRVKRGYGGGGYSSGGGYGGGGGGGGYGGGGGAAHVLLSPGSAGYYSAGAASHVLNVGSGPAFHSHSSPQQAWYRYAAEAAGDPYAAKAIGGGQQVINQADNAAANAAYGIVAAANDPNIAAEAAYAAHAADQATYNAAATRGAASVYTGTARTH